MPTSPADPDAGIDPRSPDAPLDQALHRILMDYLREMLTERQAEGTVYMNRIKRAVRDHDATH